jgi:hypothetical protein
MLENERYVVYPLPKSLWGVDYTIYAITIFGLKIAFSPQKLIFEFKKMIQ